MEDVQKLQVVRKDGTFQELREGQHYWNIGAEIALERISRSRIPQGFEGLGKECEGYCSGEPTRQMCASDA